MGVVDHVARDHAFKIQADYFYGFGRDPGDGRHVARLPLDATF